MKAILISIKPEWCDKIFSGEKTVEVRKVAPKLKPPFKVYVYQTKEGKVVGEFVYDEEMNVTKVKLYGNIKDIKKFRRPCINEDLRCTKCPKCRKAKNGRIQCYNIVTRAPRNWCYVVEE